MSPSLNRRFKNHLYLRCPVFSVQDGLVVARELCARFPKIAPALVKRAKDNLQRAADEAEAAITARSRQSHVISKEDSKILDDDMNCAWVAMLMRMDAYSMLSHDRQPKARRAEELLNLLFYSEGPDFFRDTYVAQLATVQRALKLIDEDDREAEFNDLCGALFLDVVRFELPRYERVVNAITNRDGEPLVNLLLHRNALGRAVLTYATAIALTVNQHDQDTVNQALAALEPLVNQSGVSAGRGQSVASTVEPTPTWRMEGAPLPA